MTDATVEDEINRGLADILQRDPPQRGLPQQAPEPNDVPLEHLDNVDNEDNAFVIATFMNVVLQANSRLRKRDGFTRGDVQKMFGFMSYLLRAEPRAQGNGRSEPVSEGLRRFIPARAR